MSGIKKNEVGSAGLRMTAPAPTEVAHITETRDDLIKDLKTDAQ